MTTRVTMKCTSCEYSARRDLVREAGARGVKETGAEPATCPRGHGPLVRADGRPPPSYGFRDRPWPSRGKR